MCFQENLNERSSCGQSPTPVRPRTLFAHRHSQHHNSMDTESDNSDNDLVVQDLSDSEVGSVLPGFSRLQSRLNPVPESLNSPDIATGS